MSAATFEEIPMNDAVKRAVRVYTSLSAVDREEFKRQIDRYDRANSWDQRQIREDLDVVTKVATGPMGSVCPYCGR
jgi:hypothetical protein